MTAYAAAWKGGVRCESAGGWYALETLLPRARSRFQNQSTLIQPMLLSAGNYCTLCIW